jgi:hypothetical protein
LKIVPPIAGAIIKSRPELLPNELTNAIPEQWANGKQWKWGVREQLLRACIAAGNFGLFKAWHDPEYKEDYDDFSDPQKRIRRHLPSREDYGKDPRAFDPSRCRFTTYANPKIKQFIRAELRFLSDVMLESLPPKYSGEVDDWNDTTEDWISDEAPALAYLQRAVTFVRFPWIDMGLREPASECVALYAWRGDVHFVTVPSDEATTYSEISTERLEQIAEIRKEYCITEPLQTVPWRSILNLAKHKDAKADDRVRLSYRAPGKRESSPLPNWPHRQLLFIAALKALGRRAVHPAYWFCDGQIDFDMEASKFLHGYDDAPMLADMIRVIPVLNPTLRTRDLGIVWRPAGFGQHRNLDLNQGYRPQPRPTAGAAALINFVCADGMSWQQIPRRRQLDAYCDWDEKGNRIDKVKCLRNPTSTDDKKYKRKHLLERRKSAGRGIDVAPSNYAAMTADGLPPESWHTNRHFRTTYPVAVQHQRRAAEQPSRWPGLHMGTISREVRAQARDLSERRTA